jgi:hypothetical protein
VNAHGLPVKLPVCAISSTQEEKDKEQDWFGQGTLQEHNSHGFPTFFNCVLEILFFQFMQFCELTK